MRIIIIMVMLFISSVSLAERFEVDDHGVIYDSVSGLFWYCLDDGNSNFSSVESWVSSINESRYPEGSNWRIPTLEELEDLFWDSGITWDSRSSHPFYFSRFRTMDPNCTYPNSAVFCYNTSDERRRLNFRDGEVRRVDGGRFDCDCGWAVR